jgi:uncharacterized protein
MIKTQVSKIWTFLGIWIYLGFRISNLGFKVWIYNILSGLCPGYKLVFKMRQELNLFFDISDLLKSIGSEKRIKKAIKLARFKYCQQELSFAEPLDLDIVIRNVGERLLAEGHVSGKIQLECSRCLKLFDADFCLNIEESFCVPGEHRKEEAFEIINNKIELGSLINQALFLWLPMKSLCTADCKGLCSKCGKNLNEGSCKCKADEVDPCFSALKNLLKNGMKG